MVGASEPEYKHPVSSFNNVEGGRQAPPSTRVDTSNSHVDARSGTGQSTIPGSPLPTVQREASWPADVLQSMHLSSHEPRYVPGMMARASRRDSLLRSSPHESDDAASSRNNLRKNGGREDST
ncbi:hypothetical protein F5B17DRAFT_378490 [Nemania serpens]|nr:hypothetical protein F5B17DRAFT_378490 [Nemania serpens]